MGIRKYLDREIRNRKQEPLFNKLRAFTEQYIHNKIFISYRDALKANKSRWEIYNFAVTGSDQVWRNWSHTSEEAAYYYLEFMPREKRVSYSGSFGFSQFPESDYEYHKKGLEGFDKLSCREQEGVNLIKQIINKDAQLVLDPTLLLKASQWRELSRRPNTEIPEHYVLLYIFGNEDFSKPVEIQQAIKKAAQDLPIIDLWTNEYYYSLEEFLYLFDHADLILTNSFHGTAFSINFGKNFYSLVSKNDHSGRINSILNSLNLTDHIYTPESSSRPAEINYNEVNEKLNILRESSLKYLRDCLHV